MEVSALRHPGGVALYGRSPLLRLQSDERLISLVRRGNIAAFEALVSRYQSRLLAFCRHLLGSREDAEDVLQDVMAAAFNAMLADERPINVRPWLYRIARNRCLNHLRRIQAVGVDSMDIHFSDHGASTADRVHKQEEFRMLVGDIQELPETQRTALVLREMDALSYEQIAEAMETTVPSVKSLLVRARMSLAEAAEARLLSCDEVRIELAEVAEGLQRRPGPLVRRHLRTCKRCATFNTQLKQTTKALTALMPLGPLVVLKKLLIAHLGHSAGAGSGASGATAAGQAAAVGSTAAAGTTAMAGTTAFFGTGTGGILSASMGAIASKAAAGLAAAALVTAGAVEVEHVAPTRPHPATSSVSHQIARAIQTITTEEAAPPILHVHSAAAVEHPHKAAEKVMAATTTKPKVPVKAAPAQPTTAKPAADAKTTNKTATPAGRTDTQTDPTVLAQPTTGGTSSDTTTTSTTSTTSTDPTTTTTGSSTDSGSTGSSSSGTSTDPTQPPPTGGAGLGPGDSGTNPAPASDPNQSSSAPTS